MAEKALMVSLEASKGLVRAALLDDFDTPTAIVRLGDLVKECNRYMEGVATPISSSTAPTAYPPNGLSSVLLTSVARYVTSVLRTFGLTPTTGIGFPMGGGEESQESQLSPYLDAITAFRMQVRAAAMAGDAKAVLALTDKLRDDVLPDLGVRIEDKGE
jgi:cysteinyl-tRNA synthetase